MGVLIGDNTCPPEPEDLSPGKIIKKKKKTFFIFSGTCRTFSECSGFIKMDMIRCRRCVGRHKGLCRVSGSCGKEGCAEVHHYLFHDEINDADTAHKDTQIAPLTKHCNTPTQTNDGMLLRYVPANTPLLTLSHSLPMDLHRNSSIMSWLSCWG